jgi:hypothetical protein
MGVTTIRDVGSVGDLVVEARQAMRYGAFDGPRMLTSCRIISPTGMGGRFFAASIAVGFKYVTLPQRRFL